MKKIFSLALAAVCAAAAFAPAAAQQPFFLDKLGAVAEYEVKGDDGTLISFARSTVTAIDATDDNTYTVSYSAEAMNAARKPIAPPTTMTAVVKNGTVEIAPNTMGMKIEGTVPSYPADLAVGREMEYNFSIKMMGVEAITKGKEKVTAREKITTPAGTFDCLKIESDVVVEAMGQVQNMKTVSWISTGIGTVKMETRAGSGALQMTQQLVSLK